MEYGTVGRRLGIGARIAGKLLKQHAERRARERQAVVPLADTATIPVAGNTGVRAQAVGKRMARGGRGFWSNAVGPFARAGKSLWLEITGLFFALFALSFAANAYKLRASYARGADHEHFLIYCALLALFGYFSATSFARARRTGRLGKALKR